MSFLNDLIDDEGLAKILGIKPSTVRKKRCDGTLPISYFKVGGKCLHKPSDVEAYFESTLRPAPTPKPYVIERQKAPECIADSEAVNEGGDGQT